MRSSGFQSFHRNWGVNVRQVFPMRDTWEHQPVWSCMCWQGQVTNGPYPHRMSLWLNLDFDESQTSGKRAMKCIRRQKADKKLQNQLCLTWNKSKNPSNCKDINRKIPKKYMWFLLKNNNPGSEGTLLFLWEFNIRKSLILCYFILVYWIISVTNYSKIFIWKTAHCGNPTCGTYFKVIKILCILLLRTL